MSEYDWEDSISRIRNIVSDLSGAMDDLNQAFDTAEFKSTQKDIEIKERVKRAVEASRV